MRVGLKLILALSALTVLIVVALSYHARSRLAGDGQRTVMQLQTGGDDDLEPAKQPLYSTTSATSEQTTELPTPPAADRKLNVLFLIADDMRAEIGAYNDPVYRAAFHQNIKTPHLDDLAKRSLLLKRAYVQQALCSPSRASFLTGRRPDTTRVYDIGTYWRLSGGNFTTLPQYFKEQGYHTIGLGKVFHYGESAGGNDPMSWSKATTNYDTTPWSEEKHYLWSMATEEKMKTAPLEDSQITVDAIKALKEVAPNAKSGVQPFFLAVGFRRPHLPLTCPGKFFDLYPTDEIELPRNPYAPQGMSEFAWANYGELNQYHPVWELKLPGNFNSTRPVPDPIAKDIRRAYYACVSYVDSLIGEILDTLKQLELENDTIVSFLGDHGYQLGEHGGWTKMTNFELATHAPLIVRVPGLADKGITSQALVEFVDIFPTLVESAGLPPLPTCPLQSSDVKLCTEGLSFVPLMTDPDQPWKTAAFSQYPRMALTGQIIVGYSVKTDRFRYTEYSNRGWNVELHRYVVAKELYDHSVDPDENVNLAWTPLYNHTVHRLQQVIADGWAAALPSKDQNSLNP